MAGIRFVGVSPQQAYKKRISFGGLIPTYKFRMTERTKQSTSNFVSLNKNRPFPGGYSSSSIYLKRTFVINRTSKIQVRTNTDATSNPALTAPQVYNLNSRSVMPVPYGEGWLVLLSGTRPKSWRRSYQGMPSTFMSTIVRPSSSSNCFF